MKYNIKKQLQYKNKKLLSLQVNVVIVDAKI